MLAMTLKFMDRVEKDLLKNVEKETVRTRVDVSFQEPSFGYGMNGCMLSRSD